MRRPVLVLVDLEASCDATRASAARFLGAELELEAPRRGGCARHRRLCLYQTTNHKIVAFKEIGENDE